MDSPLTVALTPELARATWDYDPGTGHLTWRVGGPRWSVGDRAGCEDHGYVRLRFRGLRLYAHRVAWMVHHGVPAPRRLDHWDLDGTHNWIANLRPATQSQNLANTALRADNSSGFKGVSAVGQKWMAKIRLRGHQQYLGLFSSAAEAGEAYRIKAAEQWGEFART